MISEICKQPGYKMEYTLAQFACIRKGTASDASSDINSFGLKEYIPVVLKPALIFLDVIPFL